MCPAPLQVPALPGLSGLGWWHGEGAAAASAHPSAQEAAVEHHGAIGLAADLPDSMLTSVYIMPQTESMMKQKSPKQRSS